MKCKCGSKVNINEYNLVNINGNFVTTCDNCKRAYNESDFSEIEIEKTYWREQSSKSE